MTLVESLVWAAVAAYGIWRLARALERFAPEPRPIGAEEVAVPDDLAALALQESEAWAQRDAMRLIREKFAEKRDWNLVRRAMGVAPK